MEENSSMFVFGFIALFALIFGSQFFLNSKSETKTIVVVDSYISVKSDKDTSKRIVTSEGETYTVDDGIIGMTYSSGTTYGTLVSNKNKPVCITAHGLRNEVLSMFPNISRVTTGECH